MRIKHGITFSTWFVFVFVLLHSAVVTAFIGSPAIQLGAVEPLEKGKTYTIRAKVTDDYGVEKVVLHFRRIGEDSYKTVTMTQQGDSGIYFITFEPGDLPEPGIQYYVRAVNMTGVVSVMPDRRQTTIEVVYSHLKEKQKKSAGIKWLVIGAGVLAVGALAAGGGGDGGSEPVADVTITQTLPGGSP